MSAAVYTNNTIPYFVFQHKTLFLPFKSLYPTCYALIKDEPQLSPLFCLKDNCHRNRGCIDILAKRVHYWFDVIEPTAELMIAYFKYPDQPNSIRAGIFNREMTEPYVMKLNISGFEKCKREGLTKYWAETAEYRDVHNTYKTPDVIPVESLIKR